MPTGTLDRETREAATLVLPGAVGVGIGVALGLSLADSTAAAGAFAALGAVAGHGLGYLLVRRRRERVD